MVERKQTFMIERIAIASLSTTTGRLTTASMVTIPAWPGTVRIGAERIEPFAPVLFTVNVPPREIVRAEPVAARALVDELAGGDREPGDRKLVGVADHRHHEAAARRDRQPDIDLA